MRNKNFHTHTYLCGHATGKIRDYIVEAIRNNYVAIGISDHGIVPKEYKRLYMDEQKLEQYLKEIDEAKKEFPNIKIYKGLENEFFQGHDDFYKDLLKKLDYLILAVHYYNDSTGYYKKSSFNISTKDELLSYKEIAVKGIESGFFKIIAHPDVFMINYKKWDETAIMVSKEIISASIKNNVLLEINAQGIRKNKVDDLNNYLYPNENFFKLVKEMKGKVIINSDCHRPEFLADEAVTKAIKFAEKLKLEVEEELNIN